MSISSCEFLGMAGRCLHRVTLLDPLKEKFFFAPSVSQKESRLQRVYCPMQDVTREVVYNPLNILGL
jgi:hypothetical protein